MTIDFAGAGFGSSVGAINGFESGATHARQGSHSAQPREVGGERVQLPPPD
jgi:hypothetical protein